MNQKQLEKKVRYWQKILKLDHWDVSCELTDSYQLNGNGGDIDVQSKYFKAHIRLLDPKFYDQHSTKANEERFEQNLLHELLHCHADPLTKGSSKHHLDHEERCVTILAKAFYDLHKEIYE